MAGKPKKRKSNPDASGEKQTLIPAFDPEALAKEFEAASGRPTVSPPYDNSSYARVVDEHVGNGGTVGRAMYDKYLQSNYPGALALAESVLERDPDHALARIVVEGCRARLARPSEVVPRLVPSSVVRLKRPVSEVAELAQLGSDRTSQIVVGHVDGVTDIARLAEFAGIPKPEALDRLHALLDLGVLEVVNG